MGDTTAEQRQAFKRIKLEKWMWPLGRLRYRPSSGLHFVWLCKWFILQYVVLRRESLSLRFGCWLMRVAALCTLAACITNALGYYCVASWSPTFSHVSLPHSSVALDTYQYVGLDNRHHHYIRHFRSIHRPAIHCHPRR